MQIIRSVVLVKTLSLIALAPFCASAQDKPHVTSEQVTRAIQELEKLAQKQIQENALAGLAIAVVFQDKAVYAKGFGVRDTSSKSPVDADTVFQLASLSKPIGSTVVAELVGEGKITWDSKLSALDPSFAMFDPWVTREITIRDMYAHRSGLPEHAGDLLEDLGFTRAEILYRLRYQHPGSSFRAHYAYTNFGMTEGGVAAAKAYGLEWEEACKEKLYNPLGMTSTSSRYADFMARRNKALGHVLVDGKWVQKFKRDPDAQSPTGGVSSSVNDLVKWLRLQLGDGKFDGKQVVDKGALAATHHPHTLTGYNPFTRYTNDFFGDISIIEKDGGLAIVQGPKNKMFRMKHYDRDTFTYETEGENAVGGSGITFTVGPDGKAAQVLVENLSVRGEGVFKRESEPRVASQSSAPVPASGDFIGLVEI